VIRELSKFADDKAVLEEFLKIKKENKTNLKNFLSTQNPIRDFRGRVLGFTEPLDEEALYDVQIKRIHEYKRQLLNVLHALMLYFELKENLEARTIKRQIIFAGKAAPGYEVAKEIIQFIYLVAKKVNNDPAVNSKLRIIFIENYNVSKAELIIPAADLSEQISTAGMEASGTGNMKLTMNGALTIGTEDGANIEMHKEVTSEWWPFSFGSSAGEIEELHKTNSYNSWSLYSQEPRIRQVMGALKDNLLAESEEERQMLSHLHDILLNEQPAELGDRYFILKDLMSYYETQKKVEELFLDPLKWAKYCMHNMAGMGLFSTDESIHNYAREVWDLKPCPVDPAYLEEVRASYSEHDKCSILPNGS
jgi:starch phosphorylase